MAQFSFKYIVDPTQKNLTQLESIFESIDSMDQDMDAGYYVYGKGIEYPSMNTTIDATNTITITSGDTGSLSGLNYSNDSIWTGPSPSVGTTTQSKIKLEGDEADIEINGKSLINTLEQIEKRLNLLTPNTQLESEWEELKVLGDQYRKLEQHIKDKQATWDKLTAMPPPEIL
jgi:hypothetical protein